MTHKVVALVLAALAVVVRAQDLGALLAQGQAGGLDLAQVRLRNSEKQTMILTLTFEGCGSVAAERNA